MYLHGQWHHDRFTSMLLRIRAPAVAAFLHTFVHNAVFWLQLEIARQKIPKSGQGMGSQDLTDIGHPIIDWTELATGMGVQHAVKAHTSEDLQDALQQALGHKGPSLIECVL